MTPPHDWGRASPFPCTVAFSGRPDDLTLRVPCGYRAEPVRADHDRRPIRRFHGCLLFLRNQTGQYTVRRATGGCRAKHMGASQRETSFHAITNRSPLSGARGASGARFSSPRPFVVNNLDFSFRISSPRKAHDPAMSLCPFYRTGWFGRCAIAPKHYNLEALRKVTARKQRHTARQNRLREIVRGRIGALEPVSRGNSRRQMRVLV